MLPTFVVSAGDDGRVTDQDDVDLEQFRAELLAGIEHADTPEDILSTVQAALAGPRQELINRWVSRLGRNEAHIELGARQTEPRIDASATSDAWVNPTFVSGTIEASAGIHGHVEITATGEVSPPGISLKEAMAFATLVTAFQPYFRGLGLDVTQSHALALVMAGLFLFGYRRIDTR
jgi:hypothetical protein